MDKEIDRIQKNPDTDIVIRIDEYLGRKGLTIREFVRSERYTGFTKAGTRIPADKFSVFKKAINAIDEKDLEGANNSEMNMNGGNDMGKKTHHTQSSPKGKNEVEELEF